MATSTVTSPIQQNSDAEYRAWGKQVSDMLQAVGLVKTADTGQVNWATAARPTTGNTYPHYEVYRFADSDPLQATRPVFIKILYGASNAVSAPGMQIEVGNGSNGAGTLTVLNAAFKVAAARQATAKDAAAYPSYAVYKPELGFLVFVGWNGSTSTASTAMLCFLISRPADDAGVVLNEALALYGFTNGSVGPVGFVWSYLKNSLMNTSTQSMGAVVPQAITASLVDNEAQLYRHYVSTPRLRHLPGLVTYMHAEIAMGAPFVAEVLGANRTFMPQGVGVCYASVRGDVLTHTLALLWE